MVDYDGADKLYTILHALTWTDPTEPTYVMWEDRQNTEYTSVVIIHEMDCQITRSSETTVTYSYTVNLQFYYSTKALAWKCIRFIVKSLFKYASANIRIVNLLAVKMSYTQKRKNPFLVITLEEVESLT